MIPNFTRQGLLPLGEHECLWDEFVVRYQGTPNNGRRRRLMLGLAQMMVLLGEAGCQRVWVDGSFVTREQWPRDFDLCYSPQELRQEEINAVLLDFSDGRRAQKARFGGEALPNDFPLGWNDVTIFDGFQRERTTGAAKGLIRLDIEPMLAEVRIWIEEREKEEGP